MRSRRSAAKLLLFLFAERRRCRCPSVVLRLACVDSPFPARLLGSVTRLLVKPRRIRTPCVFAVRLRRPRLFALLFAGRPILHGLDADAVFLVGTADARCEAA